MFLPLANQIDNGTLNEFVIQKMIEQAPQLEELAIRGMEFINPRFQDQLIDIASEFTRKSDKLKFFHFSA